MNEIIKMKNNSANLFKATMWKMKMACSENDVYQAKTTKIIKLKK